MAQYENDENSCMRTTKTVVLDVTAKTLVLKTLVFKTLVLQLLVLHVTINTVVLQLLVLDVRTHGRARMLS